MSNWNALTYCKPNETCRHLTLLHVLWLSSLATADGNRINQFFESFTSYQLFRKSQLHEDLQNIESITHINALLSAILAFTFKSVASRDECIQTLNTRDTVIEENIGDQFANLSIRYLEQAIDECDSKTVPLHLLQALALCTHWLLAQGVCGRAWRYLGLSIRCAYEMNLHLIDSGRTADESISDPTQWQRDEEQRRLWWALWEMDVFASVMRRCPTAIDWSQNETFLPSEDSNWHKCQPQKSCFLATTVMNRSRLLEASGNKCPKAWFLVINSMVKDAQNISSPVGVGRHRQVSLRNLINTKGINLDGRRESKLLDPKAPERLSAIGHSLQFAVATLPHNLRYREQILSFGRRLTENTAAAVQRLEHASIYSIHVMVQLVKLMIFKYHIFHLDVRRSAPATSATWPTNNASLEEERTTLPELGKSLERMAVSPYLGQYFKAADEIMTVVNRSSEYHYKSVNPFLSNTVWLAAVVQLVHRELAPTDVEKDRLHSNFEFLSRKYGQFATYWNTSTSLQQDLETFKNELEGRQEDHSGNGVSALTVRFPDRRGNSNKFSNETGHTSHVDSSEQTAVQPVKIAQLGASAK